jgi:hypothetical protein
MIIDGYNGKRNKFIFSFILVYLQYHSSICWWSMLMIYKC